MYRAIVTLKCLALAAVIVALGMGAAEPTARSSGERVEYVVDISEPQTQMINVALTVEPVRGDSIDFMLPVWRPGRYVVLNLSQSIRDFQAFDAQDRPLAWSKADKTTWRVMLDGAAEVRIEYRVYCNSLADRTRHVDDSHAFISGSAVFMYSEHARSLPCTLRVIKPEHWHIACGLTTVGQGPDTFHAPNYDVLVDSPLEIGEHDIIDFEAVGKPHQIVIWGEANERPDELRRDFSKIIEEQARVFGSTPYERYLFIVHAGAGTSGGTEHLNSTVMQTSRAALEERTPYQRFLNLVAHEFFHTWNIKAFRPHGLIPYAYQRENYTDLLWVVEGTTTYYAGLTLVRIGSTTPTRYFEALSTSIDAVRNRPSETVQSVTEASFDAWIHYGNRTPDDINSQVDFYGKGSLVSLLMDLEMRRRSGGKAGLDDVMRSLYEQFPVAAGRGYTVDDLQQIIESLTGADFDDVFSRFVRKADPLDFERAFEAVGVELYFRPTREEEQTRDRRAGRSTGARRDVDGVDGVDAQNEQSGEAPDTTSASESGDRDAATQPEDVAVTPTMKPFLGLNLSDGASVSGASSSGNRTTITSIYSDGPAYRSGLIVGDEILAIDGRRVTAATLDQRLRQYKPGERITVTSFRRDELRTTSITLAGRPNGRWTLRKMRSASDEQKAAYKAWLGQDW